jgi:hypothetical protein
MRFHTGYLAATFLVAGPVLLGLALVPVQSAPDDLKNPSSSGPSISAAEMDAYQRALDEYNKAWQAYAAEASAYWNLIAEKMKLRSTKRATKKPILLSDYVLNQPPTYLGPARPVNPAAPKPEVAAPTYVPVVADFLKAAKQEFNFSPQLPGNEIDFKRAYAAVAASAGLTKDQTVRIYGFEDTGNGKYDTQAGLEYGTSGERAVSTAIGYNQLIATSSVELMAEKGDQFVKTLNGKAAQLTGDAKNGLLAKISVVETMISYSRSVPDQWGQHQVLAGTPKGLGIHAMNLDLDVGPLLQTQVLVDSVAAARAWGHSAAMSAAELEMMNLTGDGNGFDMLVMPADWRKQVPSANFFDQNGYEENHVVQRNYVVATLLVATDAQMDDEVKKQGAKDLAAVFPN